MQVQEQEDSDKKEKLKQFLLKEEDICRIEKQKRSLLIKTGLAFGSLLILKQLIKRNMIIQIFDNPLESESSLMMKQKLRTFLMGNQLIFGGTVLTGCQQYFKYEKTKFRVYKENKSIVDAFNCAYVRELMEREKKERVRSNFVKI